MLYGTPAVTFAKYFRRRINNLLSFLLPQPYLPARHVVIVILVELLRILVYKRVIAEIIFVYYILLFGLFLLCLNFCHLVLFHIVIFFFF